MMPKSSERTRSRTSSSEMRLGCHCALTAAKKAARDCVPRGLFNLPRPLTDRGDDSSLLRRHCDGLLARGEVEAIEIHHLVPRRHEVLHELLLRVRAGIDFRKRAQ